LLPPPAGSWYKRTMVDPEFDARLRQAAMEWLQARDRGGLELTTSQELAQFHFEGERISLVDPQRGIRKPAVLDAALSFRTTYTPPVRRRHTRIRRDQMACSATSTAATTRCMPRTSRCGGPSSDTFPSSGSWEWHRVSTFRAIRCGSSGDEPERLQFAVALDGAQLLVHPGEAIASEERRYVERLTKLRLHQPVFRARVLQAYEKQCAMCLLRHVTLLDAAHIVPDGSPHGQPVVPNGLSLCKIHHAAFDQNILGVRPDLAVEVRRDILEEADGPMLRHGLQEMAGVHLMVPRRRDARPDPERLEERYEEFRRAG